MVKQLCQSISSDSFGPLPRLTSAIVAITAQCEAFHTRALIMSYCVVAVMLTPSVVQEAFVDVYIQEKTL